MQRRSKFFIGNSIRVDNDIYLSGIDWILRNFVCVIHNA